MSRVAANATVITNEARPASLQDYLRTVRAQRWVIAAAVVVCAGIALALSLIATPSYTARAQVQFVDESQDLSLAGVPTAIQLTPDQAASRGADTILPGGVLLAAGRAIGSRDTESELRARVKATPEQQSNLVTISATARTGGEAARLANAAANAGTQALVNQERQRFEAQATQLSQTLRRLPAQQRSDSGVESDFRQRIARLRTLSILAAPVKSASSADTPSSPTSPKPVRNVILATIVGLLLGLLVGFVRDSLDRRLRSPADIEQQLEFPLLGRVPARVLGRVSRPAGGRDEKPTDAPDFEAFRMMRANLEFMTQDQQGSTATDRAQVTVVTSALAEEGKSTVASSLATAMSVSGRRTVLVECDLRRPSLAERFGFETGAGLVDYLAGDSELDEVLRVVESGAPPGSHPESLTVLLAGHGSQSPAELLDSDRFRSLMDELATRFDAVIVDTPPLLAVVDTIELIPLSDVVLLCVRDAQTTAEQAAAAKSALGKLPPRPTAVVVTGVSASRDYYYGSYGYSAAVS